MTRIALLNMTVLRGCANGVTMGCLQELEAGSVLIERDCYFAAGREFVKIFLPRIEVLFVLIIILGL